MKILDKMEIHKPYCEHDWKEFKPDTCVYVPKLKGKRCELCNSFTIYINDISDLTAKENKVLCHLYGQPL